MDTPKLSDLSLEKRFPLPPVGVIQKQADMTYLPPIANNNVGYYWVGGILICLLAVGGIIYFYEWIKPILLQYRRTNSEPVDSPTQSG